MENRPSGLEGLFFFRIGKGKKGFYRGSFIVLLLFGEKDIMIQGILGWMGFIGVRSERYHPKGIFQTHFGVSFKFYTL